MSSSTVHKLSLFLLCCFFPFLSFSQKFEVEAGYKFNNDFTTYYKDLKPFYYSAGTIDLLVKHKRSEYILGLRYMPFLSTAMPEFGYNYYWAHDPDQKFNYFFHTTVFYCDYSYHQTVGYENYSYVLKDIKPANYTSARFTSFVHDLAFGVKMGLTPRWTIDFMVGSGYFYGVRDFAEGVIKDKTKEKYFGIQYNFRFAVKYVLWDRQADARDDE